MARQPLIVKPGRKIRLNDFDPRAVNVANKAKAKAGTLRHVTAISKLEYRLYAEGRRSVLVVLQGMDASGKDGTVRKVMQGLNPQSCTVANFKRPSLLELAHDFLWRVHIRVPSRGTIGVFNRSHYEDVVTARVHGLVPREIWERRFDAINAFEKHLSDEGTLILKFFLHISKDEQRERLQARIDDPTRRWKFDQADLDERQYWNDYQRAYEDALTRCNTSYAPWHIVPADRKWNRDFVVSRALHEALAGMKPRFPPAPLGLGELVVE
jgi:PPK2 family polyphosphate:nucleotide phosphotransferase